MGDGVQRFILRAAVAAAAAIPSCALAQQPPRVPSRPEVTPPPIQPTAPPSSRVRVDDSRAFAAAPCPLAESGTVVDLRQVTFTAIGGGPLDPGVLQVLSGIGPGAAGAQRVAIACEIRDQANEALRRAGYVATVQIPGQTVADGELRLNVVTARIVEVRIRGDAPPFRDTLAARAEQLKSLDPLNERDAERILLLAGDIPGVDVQMSLQPAGTAPGEVIGELHVSYRPYSVLANVNNLGSRELGRESVYVRGEFYGLTGASDVTYVGASTTFDFEEQRLAQIGHRMGIGDDGAGLEASLLYAWSRPNLGVLDLRSEAMVASLALSAQLERSRRRDIGLVGGFELIEQRTRIFAGGGSAPLNRDRIRVAFLRAEGGLHGRSLTGEDRYTLLASLEVRQGLDLLGATETGSVSPSGYTPSRISGDAGALVVRANADAAVALGPVLSLAGQVRSQWANNPLLNFEEFSIGNLTIGRGYDPGSNSADRAIGLRGEARARVYDGNSARVDLFAFYDSVWIWNLDPASTENDRRLASWGVGFRSLVRGVGLLEAMYAHPEHRALLIPGAERAPDRLLVSLTVQFPAGGR
ncbi:MAG TPA: ShlB/FhaC/HecB family hemolysin secretion/activation protein [Allosphingosinicella sp.]|nr:ShlB/FhaC/HecB family hemolysin secretion/activation protein [Allosphingosinicella sp.]